MNASSQRKNATALILGCGRSGTSIFGELFDHISHYSYYSEPPFQAVCTLDLSKPTAIKVPTESEGFTATDGLSFPLNRMLELLPASSKVYWQVRHPLDAISSLKVGIANNWGHHPRPPNWQEWLDLPLVQQCAHHWSYINTVGYQQVDDIVEVCRFESMLDDPLGFAQKICNDLGIDVQTSSQQLLEWSDRVQDSNNAKFIEAQTSKFYSRPDHKTKIGRWRENLSQEELHQIIPMIREASDLFGYELPQM